MIKFVRPFLNMVSKAKAAKLVRALVDLFLDMEAGTGNEVLVYSPFVRQRNHVIIILLVVSAT